jgi:spore coat protein U-like protein
MTRFMLAVCCALLSLSASAQQRVRPPTCPARPADCEINVQVFDFGRAYMSPIAPPINGYGTVSVTCNRERENNLEVEVSYQLKAIPPEPARLMHDSNLLDLKYGLFVDAARTRYWGDGGSQGTFTFSGTLLLNDRNRSATVSHQIYGKVDGGQTLTPPGQWLGLVQVRLDYQPICLGTR